MYNMGKVLTHSMLWLWITIQCLNSGFVRTENKSPGSSNPVVLEVHEGEMNHNLNLRDTGGHNISILGNDFMVDGQPFHIIAGSLHYFRLPAAYWRDRLQKLKAAGLNSVSTYVEWSFHEPEERQYFFDGDRDIVQFIKLAAEEGLHVLLRPGPYICAERDLGGLPYWLLKKYPTIKLRSTDKNFMKETEIWMNKLFEKLNPFLFGNGGPIILVQIENEYGSYGSDNAYKTQLRDIMLGHVKKNALLYTTDGTGTDYFTGGAVSGALTTIDFGVVSGDVMQKFGPLRQFMPTGPLMNSEFYPGWLTHWGEPIQQVGTAAVVKTMCDMLDNKVSLNFYVFFGGTNFEFSAGSNYGPNYLPDITSYDYDAPLSEAGDPTPKYDAIREALKKYVPGLSDIPAPKPSPKGAYGKASLTARVNLLSTTGRKTFGTKYGDFTKDLPTFEHLGQRAGLVLYETTLVDANGVLRIEKPRDRVHVYVNGILKGIISRSEQNFDLRLTNTTNAKLSLLVENQGRINYGALIHDFKGIRGHVKYNNKVVSGTWSVTGYPLQSMDSDVNETFVPDVNNGPILFEGNLVLPEGQEPLDTFIKPTGWGKGFIWINGHNLGRYWPAKGPQVTLYVPGVWLEAAPKPNRIQILELDSNVAEHEVEFINYPILNGTNTLYYTS